jgi:predicted alpha/beta hydrolase
MEDIIVRAADGFPLAATIFGEAASARAAVIVPPAMGVSRGYYRAFAEWLAERGYLVATFDYRGIGGSRPSTLRDFEADILAWARLDAAAVVDSIPPRLPLLWIGHSLGAQILGLVPNRARVAAMVSVAAGSGYWLQNSLKLRAMVWWLWFVAVPVSVKMCGYFPGRRLKKVGDVPGGVMLQWRQWCLDPEYVVGVEGEAVRAQYAALRIPMLSLSFTDDEFMSAANIESLNGFYAGCWRDRRRLAPRDVGSRSIGHFGFFRRRFEPTLWRLVDEWLEARLDGH